jgi:hypothetical protein
MSLSLTVTIKIDSRERELIQICKDIIEKSRLNNKKSFDNINLISTSLPIGDAIISIRKTNIVNVIVNDIDKSSDDKTEDDNNNDNTDCECIIIERKSLNDLMASIKDGRYTEQSYRLNGSTIYNHNIYYLIEGDINKSYANPTVKSTLYSAIFSMSYYKGFSLLRSMNMHESGVIICNMAQKIVTNIDKNKHQPFYGNININDTATTLATTITTATAPILSKVDEDESTSISYSSVIKKVKKENITPENIGEIILCQIPSISSVMAVAIMQEFKTVSEMILQLKPMTTEEQVSKLQNITYLNSNKKVKKITKPAVLNIVKYLLS